MPNIGIAPPDFDSLTGYIYALMCKCHPEAGLMYVGKTTRTVEKRVKEHIWESNSGTGKYAIHNWIRKHGAENIEIVTLEQVGVDYLDELECLWIERLETYIRKDKLNLAPGGWGRISTAPEIREKISLKAKEKWASRDEEFKNRVRKRLAENGQRRYNLGVKMSEEQKDLLRQKAIDRGSPSLETRKKMSEAWYKHKRLPTTGPGALNGRATISEETARKILSLKTNTRGAARPLSEELGVSIDVVRSIWAGRTWSHLREEEK